MQSKSLVLTMKLALRILAVAISLVAAYFCTEWVTSFTGAPLTPGHYEATPAAVFGVYTVFPLTLLAAVVAANMAISRYYRKHSQQALFSGLQTS